MQHVWLRLKTIWCHHCNANIKCRLISPPPPPPTEPIFGKIYDKIATLYCLIIIININPLTARVVGAPQVISQPVSSIFPCSPLPSGTFHFFLCLPCLRPPFTVPCKMVLARPDERETWPYHCSVRLFPMVWGSSCGPAACWILARTCSSVTWPLCEMCSISRQHLIFHQMSATALGCYLTGATFSLCYFL